MEDISVDCFPYQMLNEYKNTVILEPKYFVTAEDVVKKKIFQ